MKQLYRKAFCNIVDRKRIAPCDPILSTYISNKSNKSANKQTKKQKGCREQRERGRLPICRVNCQIELRKTHRSFVYYYHCYYCYPRYTYNVQMYTRAIYQDFKTSAIIISSCLHEMQVHAHIYARGGAFCQLTTSLSPARVESMSRRGDEKTKELGEIFPWRVRKIEKAVKNKCKRGKNGLLRRELNKSIGYRVRIRNFF